MLQEEHSAILSTVIKLPFVIKIFVLSIFEWLFYTAGMRKFRIGQDFLIGHWHIMYIMSVDFAEIYV